MCECIKLTFRVVGEQLQSTTEIFTAGTFNGENYYTWNYAGVDYFLYFDLEWQVSIGGLGLTFPFATSWKNSEPPCPPLGSMPVWIDGGTFDIFTTEECEPTPPPPIDSCDCGINLVWDSSADDIFWNLELQISGSANGKNTYQFQAEIGGINYNFILGWNPTNSQWEIGLVELFQVIATLRTDTICPIGDLWSSEVYDTKGLSTSATECKECGIEERIFREYDSIKLPENFEEPNRGLKGCCECEYLVFGSGSSSTFENDVTSAWMKLSDSADIITFVLEDSHGNSTNYIPTPQAFINEPFAYYTTIRWKDVLNSDGEGCYTLKIQYEISGIVGFVIWGKFKLQKYSIQSTLKTARVRAFFNAYHEIEQIDFTNSNVESSFRFYGFIGNRQPNTEIDNIIYQNREMKRVIRENLNQYEIITEPVFECFTRPLIELFLLSENDLFISDYNAHNHSYRIQDLPVIVEESATLDYLPLSRYAILKCKVGDKFKNKRTYF
jgi:hypothetical protein